MTGFGIHGRIVWLSTKTSAVGSSNPQRTNTLSALHVLQKTNLVPNSRSYILFGVLPVCCPQQMLRLLFRMLMCTARVVQITTLGDIWEGNAWFAAFWQFTQSFYFDPLRLTFNHCSLSALYSPRTRLLKILKSTPVMLKQSYLVTFLWDSEWVSGGPLRETKFFGSSSFRVNKETIFIPIHKPLAYINPVMQVLYYSVYVFSPFSKPVISLNDGVFHFLRSGTQNNFGKSGIVVPRSHMWHLSLINDLVELWTRPQKPATSPKR